ncbi:MAG TPA: hypothetical protein VGT41_03335 [Candidatus Babeliales bacterium]|nr:hypothetical protein [Candidatus Babeliales bacterium]
MDWKKTLLSLERNEEWDTAIAYMQNVIAENPNDVDATICMNYLLMYSIVYETYDYAIAEYRRFLAKKYFKESYAKFSENAEYLFFTGLTAVMEFWNFDIEDEDIDNMLKKAVQLDRNNILYTWGYSDVERNNLEDAELAKKLLTLGSASRKQLESKGAVGEYLIGIMETCSVTNKDKLQKNINEYLFGQIDTSSFCYACCCYYADGLRGGEFNQQEQKLFFELSKIADRYIESTKNPATYTGTPFLESELKQKTLEVQQVLNI